jgi:transcriptional repressor NrdR
MKCPFCGHSDSKVVDSRDTEQGTIRRRRECQSCRKRFTTYERVEAVPLLVVKKDGRREEFDRNKLIGGLLAATKKRPVPRDAIEQLVDDVENALRGRGATETPSPAIGEEVMQRLRELDEIAYIRFASVYRQFKDVNDVRGVMEELLSRPPGTRAAQPRRQGRTRAGRPEEELPLNLERS